MMHAKEGMHVDVWDKTSNFFHFEGRGSDIKQYGFPFFTPVTFWKVPNDKYR